MGKRTAILINYDKDNFPVATGRYVEHALIEKGYSLTTHPQDAQLILNVDGCSQFITHPGVKTVYWEIDTYRHRGAYADRLRAADIIFVATMDPEELTTMGYPLDKTVWLPVAFDREIHKPHDVPKEYDIVFVGSTHFGRQDLLDKLAKKYKVHQTQNNENYAQEMSRGKLIFNKSSGIEVNSRFFEGMAIGALLTDYLPVLDRLANVYEHYIPYRDEEDMFEQVEKYLADNDARETIALQGRTHALAHHTFHHRVETLMQHVGDLYV